MKRLMIFLITIFFLYVLHSIIPLWLFEYAAILVCLTLSIFSSIGVFFILTGTVPTEINKLVKSTWHLKKFWVINIFVMVTSLIFSFLFYVNNYFSRRDQLLETTTKFTTGVVKDVKETTHLRRFSSFNYENVLVEYKVNGVSYWCEIHQGIDNVEGKKRKIGDIVKVYYVEAVPSISIAQHPALAH